MTPTTRVRLLVPRLNGKPGDEGVISCKWRNGGYMVKFESKNPDKPVVRHCYEYEIEVIGGEDAISEPQEPRRGVLARK